MPKSRGFRSSSYRRKLYEKIKPNSSKSWRIAFTRTCIILTVFSLLLSFCGSVGADYVMFAPPQDIVITETNISVSLTTPARTVFINVTEYDAWQIVKNITVEFREPVAYVGFALYVLNDRPTYTGMPRNETVREYSNDTVLQYCLIRFLTKPADTITNVTMVLAVEKAAAQEKDEEITLMLYRYNGRKMEEVPAEKFEEDATFSYFNTTTVGSAYVAITRVLTPTLWWPVLLIVAMVAVAFIAAIGVCVYKRFKSANIRKMVNT